MSTKKKSAAVLQHCDAGQCGDGCPTNHLNYSLSAAWRGVKYMACMLGSAFSFLIGVWFFCAPIEGDVVNWSAGIALLALCVWIAVILYQVAESEGGDGHDK